MAREPWRAFRPRHGGHRHGNRRAGDKLRVTRLTLEQSGAGTEGRHRRGRSRVLPERLDDRCVQPRLHDAPPPRLTKADSQGWKLWEKIAKGRPEFGNPAAFNSSIPESYWGPLPSPAGDRRFFDQMRPSPATKPAPAGSSPSRIQLADVGRALSPAAFCSTTEGRPGVLGLCAASRSRRRLRGQADVGMRRRRHTQGALRPSQLRPRCVRERELHSLPHALHHQHVHAAQKDDRPLPVPANSRISPSSASSSRSPTMSCSRWNIRCARRRRRSISCWNRPPGSADHPP